MKILVFTYYDRLGASSRLRFFQYFSYLESRSVTLDLFYLLSSGSVGRIQRGERAWREALPGYLRRLLVLLRKKDYDLIWIEKECFPWLPAVFESALLGARPPYVLDYDDAVFYRYDHHDSYLVHSLLANKHRRLMEKAALVIAGNQYLEDFANSCAPRRLIQLPTAIDLERYLWPLKRQPKLRQNSVQIGWIGQRSTAKFLKPFTNLFLTLMQEQEVSFKAIGIDPEVFGLPMKGVVWTEDTEVASIRDLDIGIMPLTDGFFERGKCGYKLIQYMACGLPVVASPVGVNKEIVEHGVNGFLAESEAEWSAALRTLITNPSLRDRMGAAGRRKVEHHYCIQVTAPKLFDSLKQAISDANS